MRFVQIHEPQLKENIVRKILEALPDWFGLVESREQYIGESRNQICIGAIEDGECIGFLCLKETGKDTLEIAVMEFSRNLKYFLRCGMKRIRVRYM